MFLPSRGANRTNSPTDTRPVNNMAIIGFVLSFTVPLAGVVISHVALRKLKTLNERGWKLAVFGVCIGYCALAYEIVHALMTAASPS